MTSAQQGVELPTILPDPDGRFGPCPTVVREQKLIRSLRISEVSNATDYKHVIENLRRRHVS